MNKLYAVLKSMRPWSWPKNFFVMLLGAYFALHSFPSLMDLLLGFVIVGPVLWGGLYLLNDCSDKSVDNHHIENRKRPIALGLISTKLGYMISFLLILIALISSSIINVLFFYFVLVMLVSQVLYTLKPFRLKDRGMLGIIVPSILNPASRFFAGWFLFTSQFSGVPWGVIVILILAKLMSHISCKYYWCHGLEKRLDDKTAITFYDNLGSIKKLILSLFILLTALFSLLCINALFNNKIPYIGLLPFQFILLIPLAYIGLPFYLRILNKPHSMNTSLLKVVAYTHIFSIMTFSLFLMK